MSDPFVMGSRMCNYCHRNLPSPDLCGCDGEKVARVKFMTDELDRVGPRKMGTDPAHIAAQLRDIVRISEKYDLRECIEGHDDALGDSFVWRDLMEQCEIIAASLGRPKHEAFFGRPTPDSDVIGRLVGALEPFAAMGRVMETRARVTFGKIPKDSEIVCESSGEAGMGILTMGHFRDAAALLPNAPGWGGMYKPLSRQALASIPSTTIDSQQETAV